MPEKGVFIHKKLPYFAQWESRDLVEKIVNRKIAASDDPLWCRSGAKTQSEYELWSWNGCGMACLKMILTSKFGKNYSIVTLGKRCMEFGGYVLQDGKLDGLYYKPFLRFIKEDFGLDGEIFSPMFIDDVISHLEKRQFVIASVSAKIRDLQATPPKRGGHLVLVAGYDYPQKKLLIHNPSGFKSGSQEYAGIAFDEFAKFFSNRGIVIF